ncbi:hypothetical protein QO198_16080, partial [Pseudoalteromonas distincta]|uniref:hypothetical protein n=1 Tax=Pseudoalteromonas distincta TaxID=77608 RepID=UPI00352E3671
EKTECQSGYSFGFITSSKSVAPLNLLVNKSLIKGFACHANKLTVNLTLAVDAELARVRSAASNHSILVITWLCI